MLDRTASRLLFASFLAVTAACGGDDDDGGDNPADDGGGGNGDGGGGNNADAAVNSCAPVSGTNLALEPVASGLDEPLFVTSPPGDTRLFVVEKLGVIKIVKDGAVLPTPFLTVDVEGEPAPNEQGLLGLAFHPRYGMNGRFYVFYTAQVGPDEYLNVVDEYTVSEDPDIANAGSRKLILQAEDRFRNHNGGMIDFGPDDMLYIGMGDGGDGGDPDGNGQNRQTLLGDMLRIDVDGGDPYGIPDDNPLVGQGGGVREEIWLSGLRNPWRWSFDLENGDLYIGDVGQNDTEEINVVPAGMKGLDLGWDQMEGNDCFGGADCDPGQHFAPAHTYAHGGGDRSVTGGYVYRGTCFPDIVGWYFFADWSIGRVFKLEYSGGNASNDQDITDDIDPEGVLDGLASFGQDIFGEVYIVSLYGGAVYRIIVE